MSVSIQASVPTVGVGSDDLAQALRESAMLADVTIGKWGAEKSDRAAMEKVKADAGAKGNVGRVIKNTLAGADDKLKKVHSEYEAVRQLHYQFTLPWTNNPHALRQQGPRLLPLALFNDYLKKLHAQKRVAEAALDDFLADYPALVQQARANLAALADVDYPSVDEVRAAFHVTVDYNPMPVGSDFKSLPANMLERLSKNLNTKQEAMVASAQAEMWARAKKRVEHLVEKMKDPEAGFKYTTIEKLRELIELMPGWNFQKDPRVQEIVKDISDMLHGLDAETLRNDARMRQDTATAGQKVVDKLKVWGL